MRCAIVHYWLLGMRGGEKVLEALCRILPDADIFTLFYDPERVSPAIRAHRIQTSFLNGARRYYRSLLPLMPMALEHFDLRGYDLVISSESGPAKGVITSAYTRHVCYCHSPMRYIWDLYPDYIHDWTHSRLKRWTMAATSNYMRLWDYAASARVDEFVANSQNVQRRIWKAYRRDSDIVYPPVAVDSFFAEAAEDYYLIVSELVAYKRVEDAVRCFSRTGRRLKVVGQGPEYRALRKMAAPNIEFLGRMADPDLKGLYARSRAVLMPGEEDFGIVPVEALASGKPVIALRRGGVVETVPEHSPRAGFFYDLPGEEGLQSAVERFEKEADSLSPEAIRSAAQRFSEAAFHQEMSRLLLGQTVGSNTAALAAAAH